VLAQTDRCLPFNNMRLLAFIGGTLLVAASSFGRAECQAPVYKKGRVYADSKSEIYMQISISPANFSPQKLRCLARHLHEVYSNRDTISIGIYDSENAAKTDKPLTVEADGRDYERAQHRHADYIFDRIKKEEELILSPNVLHWKEFSTHIDLKINGVPTCTLQIQSRCLVAFNDLKYPRGSEGSKTSGTVVLSGRITSDGVIRQLRVIDKEANNPTRVRELVDAAVSNFKSWRFEESNYGLPIRISYSFVIDNSENLRGQTDLQFELPERVIVRVNANE